MELIINRLRPIFDILSSRFSIGISFFGDICLFSYTVVYWSFRQPFRWGLVLDQLYFIGNRSVFIIVLAGSFTGMVMCYQTYFGFKLISVDSLVGSITAISLAKELAPVLTGLIVTGRAGAAMAAEIGSMKVTEQIDALEVMGINSIQYLASPRVIASVISVPMLSTLFLFVGNLGSWIVGVNVLSIDDVMFFSKLGKFMFVSDIFQGIIKAAVFGFLIAVIGTYCGFNVKQGARGVGIGTNKAVVWGMIFILFSDYLLTTFMVNLFNRVF